VVEDTKDVSLNTLEIDIKETKLETGGKTLTPESHSHNEDTQTDKFAFGETLSAGSKATLTVKFIGQLNDKMAGLCSLLKLCLTS